MNEWVRERGREDGEGERMRKERKMKSVTKGEKKNGNGTRLGGKRAQHNCSTRRSINCP